MWSKVEETSNNFMQFTVGCGSRGLGGDGCGGVGGWLTIIRLRARFNGFTICVFTFFVTNHT